MRRIDTPNKAADLFGPGKHGWKNGVPGTADRPTEGTAAWFNAVQEELARVVESAGGSLDSEDNGQLLDALLALFPSIAKLQNAGVEAYGDALLAVNTAGVPRTQHQWNAGQHKNLVSDFGAVGDDATDNAAVIEAAMAWMAANGGGTLYIPPGIYRHSTPIKCRDGIRFIGAGKYDTIFVKTGSGTINVSGADADLVCLKTTGGSAKMSDGAGNVNCCLWLDAPIRAAGGEIAHLTLRGNGANATGSLTRLGFAGIGASEYRIHDVHVEFVSLAAFVLPVFFASTFFNNHAFRCGKGFAFEAGTSLAYHSNYAIYCQWHGHYFRDISYSSFAALACDGLNNVGNAADYADRSVNSVAYVLDACRGVRLQAGAEECFGTQLLVDSCIDADIDLVGLGPASSYTGAAQVALVYVSTLAQGVRLNSVLFERGGATALQGAAVAGNHHDLYVSVASHNDGFRIGSWRTCNNRFDAPSAIYGNVVPSYLRPLKQGSRIQGEFTPVLALVSATGVAVTYGANNRGRFDVDDDGFMTVDINLDIASVTYVGSPVYPELQGLPFENASAKNGRLLVDQTANVTWASTEPYWVDVLPNTKTGTIRNRTGGALLTCPTAFASGSVDVYLHIVGRIYVGDVVDVV